MRCPLVYEINTRCWLYELSQQHGSAVTLGEVPETEFARWRQLGFTHIWLMGVWRTGPRSREVSRRFWDQRAVYSELLPDFSDDDLIGSPYAVAGYEVSEALGGERGLAAFRARLNSRGMKLILDFIPNHLGLDHPWLEKAPERFVQSAKEAPGTFRQQTVHGPRWIAHGKDPFFPPWADTAQLDYRNPDTRAAMIEELHSVARRCDGVRCDMAMLLLNEVFARNWERFPTAQTARGDARPPRPAPGRSSEPEKEFWAEAIAEVKAAQPDFLFLAEAYWDLESRLIDLGFDFAYDKMLMDHLVARRGGEVQRHLLRLSAGCGHSRQPPRKDIAAAAYFLENHDEPRIASVLSVEEHRAAALLILSLPGMRLLHEGQLTGALIRASVHLRRRPAEAPNAAIAAFYERFLAVLQTTPVGSGHGEVLKPFAAWETNPTAENLMIVQWQKEVGAPERARGGENDQGTTNRADEMGSREFFLSVVNLASHASQCHVRPRIDGLSESDWEMTNLLGPEKFSKSGEGLLQNGLYLDVAAHGAQLFRFEQR